MTHILLINHHAAERSRLRGQLEPLGYSITEASSVAAAERQLPSRSTDLVIAELSLPEGDILELIRSASPSPTIVLADAPPVSRVVAAMKAGAYELLVKPVSAEELVNCVNSVLRDSRAADATISSEESLSSPLFTGRCKALKRLSRDITKVAATDSTVLIQGETGTGKELTARQVHSLSRRRDGPLVAVNCAAIPETLIESELFGYEKGAFTGATSNRKGLIEAASGGSLFLDEIGELPLAAQARLLRFSQEGEIRRIGSVTSKRVDARLICATHRDLAQLTRENAFRSDLFYRINVLGLYIPPLRDRTDDLMDMAVWFISAISARLDLAEKALSDAAIDAIMKHAWPGNVRELEHAVERAVVMAEGNTIEPEDLGLKQDLKTGRSVHKPQLSIAESNDSQFEDSDDRSVIDEEFSLEDYFMRFVLEHQDSMNETQLAQKLGISRKCLWERRQRFGLPRNRSNRTKSA